MTAPAHFPRFFVTSAAPCPYLPGKMERKVFTELRGLDSHALHDALGRIGFRRSQNVAYRPSCAGCKACVAVRVLTQDFAPSATQRKEMRRNSDLITEVKRPWATEEQFALLQRYLSVRHPGGGMTDMDEADFADMVEQTPVHSYVIEYREPGIDGLPGKLVGACLTDHQADGLSMIYSFYDPHHAQRTGLGNYIILDHIRRAGQAGLPYLYLGYWVEGSPRMQYKVRYRPMERLGPEGWVAFDPDEQQRVIGKLAEGSMATRSQQQVGSKASPALVADGPDADDVAAADRQPASMGAIEA